MIVRIKFAKRGTMKYIGHLDMMRCFQKAFRRAEVDIAYSEGFSPHQKMSFAAPLGVGLTSEGEYLDIIVHSFSSSSDMKQALNDVMPEDMEIKSCRVLPENAVSAMSLVAAADYRLTFRNGYEPESIEYFFQNFKNFIKQDSISIVKTTKKGERQLDIKPLIYHADADEVRGFQTDCQGIKNGNMNVWTNHHPSIYMTLCTGSTSNIKPELVMSAYVMYAEEHAIINKFPNLDSLHKFMFEVERLEVYANKGSDSNRDLVTLEDLGIEK